MRLVGFLLFLGFLPTASWADTSGTGFVTPTSMTLTFTSVSLIKSDNSQTTVMSSSVDHTFNRTDKDFGQSALGTINIPVGTPFIGIQVCYNTNRSVVLNGVNYQGTTVGSISSGTPLYSSGSNALTGGSITKNNPGTATTLTGYTIGTGSNNCSTSYFAKPICVGTSCDATQYTVIDPASASADVNLVLDLYNSVGIDANNLSLDNHTPAYPYATLGTPGAAYHFVSSTGGTSANISLIFDANKKLLWGSAYGSGPTGFCSGVSFTTVTAAPAGGFMNNYGVTAVMSADTTTGKVQFAAGNCPNGTSCSSSGMVTIDNFLIDQAAAPTVSCPADSAASPPYLGYTYTSGAGVATPSNAWTLGRIVDPNNIFGHCASGKTGFITGSNGTCGDYF